MYVKTNRVELSANVSECDDHGPVSGVIVRHDMTNTGTGMTWHTFECLSHEGIG